MSSEPKPKRPRGRPPKIPADAETRKQLIRSGLIFLTERGYSSAGINEIINHAGVPKGCFYHYFRSKEDFGDQLIEAYQNYFSEKLERCLQDETRPPLERLQGFVAEATTGMTKHHFTRGCLVGNLGQEMGTLPETFRSKLVSIFQDWQNRTENCLRLAQSAGQIGHHHDPKERAALFWIGWEGAVLRAKLERGPQPLTVFANGFFSLLSK